MTVNGIHGRVANALCMVIVWWILSPLRGTKRTGGASNVDWHLEDNPVIAFRVTKEHKEPVKPREFWVDNYGTAHDDFSAAYDASRTYPIHVREVLGDE